MTCGSTRRIERPKLWTAINVHIRTYREHFLLLQLLDDMLSHRALRVESVPFSWASEKILLCNVPIDWRQRDPLLLFVHNDHCFCHCRWRCRWRCHGVPPPGWKMKDMRFDGSFMTLEGVPSSPQHRRDHTTKAERRRCTRSDHDVVDLHKRLLGRGVVPVPCQIKQQLVGLVARLASTRKPQLVAFHVSSLHHSRLQLRIGRVPASNDIHHGIPKKMRREHKRPIGWNMTERRHFVFSPATVESCFAAHLDQSLHQVFLVLICHFFLSHFQRLSLTIGRRRRRCPPLLRGAATRRLHPSVPCTQRTHVSQGPFQFFI